MPSGIGTAGAGAELTSEQVARILVNPLQARSVVLRAGPRVFDSQGGTSGVTLGAGVVPTIDNLLDAQGSLLAANASLDTAAWFG
ncbi:MAG TPA: hypothetical protein VHW42_00160, partial [Actinomycetes bacterium]|nr:hypothetical protein [Actinomycetes bacterium]